MTSQSGTTSGGTSSSVAHQAVDPSEEPTDWTPIENAIPRMPLPQFSFSISVSIIGAAVCPTRVRGFRTEVSGDSMTGTKKSARQEPREINPEGGTHAAQVNDRRDSSTGKFIGLE